MSALDEIRVIYRRAESRRRLIDLPVWWSSELDGGAEVVIRCQPINAKRLGEITGAAVDGQSVNMAAAPTAMANLIAEATVDIRIIQPDGTDDGLSPDGPVRFTPQLADLLGWDDPPATAAETVERFLRTDEAPLAVHGLAMALQQQLSGGITVVAREALGESTAAA